MSMAMNEPNDGMANATGLLPKEVIALIHHIELNKDGWWDKATQRLVLAAIWLASEPLGLDKLAKVLKSDFSLKLSNSKIGTILSSLEQQNYLVKLPGELYRIPDVKRTEFEKEVEASEQAEKRAKDYFACLIKEQQLRLDPEVAWSNFASKFLAPLIKEVGANAYRLVTGENTLEGKDLVDQFLDNFPQTHHQQLSEVAKQFLNPKVEGARAYISRLLHARLCVEASGLPAEVIGKIKDSSGKPIRFRIFVDTNFLFSLMGIHENPSNETANELQDLIAHLKANLRIDLFITPKTIEEARGAIMAAQSQLQGIPTGNNFMTVALHVGLSGMAQKFLMERGRNGRFMTSEEWFRPYLDNFVAIANGKGIQIFQESQDGYSARQDVIDDINLVMDHEKGLHENRRKSYERVAHDMVLWHFVRDKRFSYVESPIDARDWILTVDFRFISFDQRKLRQSRKKIPLCLHPTSLIQLLQFWVPRTKEFEEAMLGSLRLPFLFQEFDAGAERTTLKILRGLGRFDGSSEMSEATISNVIMSDGLRARLAASVSGVEEITLIRDALLEDSSKRLEAERNKAQQLEYTIQSKDLSLSALDEAKKEKDQEVEKLRLILSEKESHVATTEQRNESQAALIAELKAKAESSYALRKYLGLLLIILLASSLAGWLFSTMLPQVTRLLTQTVMLIVFSIVVFIAGHLGLEMWFRKSGIMCSLWPFVQVKLFRKWLWSLVVLSFILGVVGNLVANNIQKNIDNEPQVTNPAVDESSNTR